MRFLSSPEDRSIHMSHQENGLMSIILERISLFCVDKYGRETFKQDYKYNLTLEKLYSMTFDFAIEDSPAAFEHVLHFDNCKVAVFNRPWNSALRASK